MNENGKVAFRSYHDWILPKKILLGILIFSSVFLFIGVILLAVSGGSGTSSAGAVLAGLGGCGFTILLLLCLHAYFVFYENDESTQTWENITSDITLESSDFPAYAAVQKPSALKDGSLKKNGKPIAKKVTLPPDIDAGNGNKSPVINTVAPSVQPQYVPQQYEYPTYTEIRKHPYGQGPQPSPQSPIYPQQSPHMQSSPAGYGQPFPVGYPKQVYPLPRNQPNYPPQSRLGYDDDYDNTVESTPMMTQQINARNLIYRPVSDIPEPQPLVYPSAKRPMVFEQTSSSKMSIYDNVGKEDA